ncbi:hypothetical protein [Natrinema sp. 1APR25-10V2]|uniref:hypothetical protein n=1 Tax=Natrinema sp. 1APR25-10V2 TaxID=2951081 RepID=UPI0028767D51|nr:hypothetical protein [Natrinema sp. 1APR25-10V2]MDS0475780.1 hypothetical protein [Natrinema sp. 1APR25-10V2]
MSPNRRSFVDPLLEWYENRGRHRLPWREPGRSAFEILIAEILLQRTTASAVAGAYAPFVARHPTPEAVVAARSDELEERIAPLGLSKRAAFLERCSGRLLARHSGTVPRRRSELLALHGVGEYTARSVQIHAFGDGIAAVDTNVRRLVARFVGLEPDSSEVAARADGLVPPRRSSDFQHAMLDFAAAVCTPRDPDCDGCPLAGGCDSAETAADG